MSSHFLKLTGKPHDLGGGFTITRALPQAQKRMVGPFTFFDHMGPVEVRAGQNVDVRPHPHIGLSTLTYLLEGRMVHRDSLGSEVTIQPGDVNWMTAGKGICHSERVHKDDHNRAHRLQGLQFWIALPDDLEDIEPSFDHYEKSKIPFVEGPDQLIKVVAGEAFGLKSSVKTSSKLVLVDILAKAEKAKVEVHFPGLEIGIYVVEGEAQVADQTVIPHELLVLPVGQFAEAKLSLNSRVVLLGGEPFTSPRFMWWNLVSSSKEKIEKAKQSWKDRSFPMVPGETDFIPGPE
jgi:redox-sensitive bicupin YhaK (pirin superfamily)